MTWGVGKKKNENVECDSFVANYPIRADTA